MRHVTPIRIFLVWMCLNILACSVYVHIALANIASSEVPVEVYANDPSFQIIAYVFVFGVPALLLLVVMYGIYFKIVSRTEHRS